jgi:Fe-S-cluster containining protein
MAGYVRVGRDDIRRLAKHLGLTSAEFERRHILEVTKKGEKRIKEGFKSCQFLTEDRMCGVYEARPNDCRGYVCWNQEDTTVFDYARFYQLSIAEVRQQDTDAGVKAR